MSGPHDNDLLPLFLEEAGERLERVLDLVGRAADDPKAAGGLRRELHALKGASRMMGLTEMSELCHRAEDLSASGSSGDPEELASCCAEIASIVEGLGGTGGEREPARPPVTQRRRGQSRRGRRGKEMRIPSHLIDDLADRAARLRVIAVAAEGLSDRVFRLATLAERGVGERAPEQVLATLATSLRQVGLELEGGQRIFRRLTDRQLETLLHLQVQPLRPFMQSLARHAKELADSLNKRIDVHMDSGDTHLDRRISNALREAFLHLVRNAVDHGVETPEDRRRAGKPETAEMWLEARTDGDRVRLVVRDDGRGIDTASVLEAAIELDLVREDEARALSEAGILQLLLLPGFSTRDEASQVSGRGVGLDAVAAAVRAAGGDLWLETEMGVGTTVSVEVPVARRGERLLVLKVGEHQLALPAAPVNAFQRLVPESIIDDGGVKKVRIKGQTSSPRFLSDLVDGAAPAGAILVETAVGGAFVGVVADEVIGEEEAIVRPIPAAAGAPNGIEGIALLASGRPVAVLSLQRLGPGASFESVVHQRGPDGPRPIRVLLVDDSVVTREMVRRLLEDGGLRVVGVGSAEDALHAMVTEKIDCLVTDIEMPEMNGLELTREIRSRPEFEDLPIVVVSTLDHPSDRLAGLEAGADAYLTKQGLDARELVALIYRVAGDG